MYHVGYARLHVEFLQDSRGCCHDLSLAVRSSGRLSPCRALLCGPRSPVPTSKKITMGTDPSNNIPNISLMIKYLYTERIWNLDSARRLDVSHVVPLSLNAQMLRIAAKVVELVDINSRSPVADLGRSQRCSLGVGAAKLQSHRSRPFRRDDPSSHWAICFWVVLLLRIFSIPSWARKQPGNTWDSKIGEVKNMGSLTANWFNLTSVGSVFVVPRCLGGSMSSWIKAKSSPSLSALRPAPTSLGCDAKIYIIPKQK